MSHDSFRTYPELAPGQYRRTMPDLHAREALFVRPAWCLSVMWRGPERLTHGWEVRLVVAGNVVALTGAPTLREAFADFRALAGEVVAGRPLDWLPGIVRGPVAAVPDCAAELIASCRALLRRSASALQPSST